MSARIKGKKGLAKSEALQVCETKFKKVVQQSKEKVFKKPLKVLMYCFCVILVKFVSTTRLRRLYVYLYGDEFPLKSLLQLVFK